MSVVTPSLVRRARWFGVGLVTALAALAAPAAVYHAADDFSPVLNPNGAWQYGWANAVGGAFQPHSTPVNLGGLSVWSSGLNMLGGYDPVVAHNGTAAPVGNAELTWQPGQLSLHPGVFTAPFDIYTQRPFAVMRWTAPIAGDYALDAEFFGLDLLGRTGTDVHLLVNGSSIFDDEVVGYGGASKVGFVGVRSLQAGDTLDVVVGPGALLPPFGDYQFDTTAVNLTISVAGGVPEPATLGLLTLGLVAIGSRWRSR